jgi:hypothetical protein
MTFLENACKGKVVVVAAAAVGDVATSSFVVAVAVLARMKSV